MDTHTGAFWAGASVRVYDEQTSSEVPVLQSTLSGNVAPGAYGAAIVSLEDKTGRLRKVRVEVASAAGNLPLTRRVYRVTLRP